ncbi:hypothetical protein ACFPK9_16010 [Rubritalea spongiae]|uniref:hypothetical protein n=1 Tax=Rubritalea spongiae TaxID=430797 RepID=UPI00360DFC8A
MLNKSDPPRIIFGQPSHGWMTITVDEFRFDASDVPCDSLYGLCKALNSILSGSIDASVDWSLEPNYLVWKFTNNTSNCTLIITDHNDTLLASLDAPTDKLIRSIIEAIITIKPFFDLDQDQINWSWDYPSDAILNLKNRLA